jgi:hypothetical protein
MAYRIDRNSYLLAYTLLTITILFFFLPLTSFAAQVSFAWDVNDPPVDGYLLFMRADDNAYDYLSPVWSGTETTCTIDELTDGTYYFVVHAYSGTAESSDSNEVKVIISDSIVGGTSNDCDVDGLDLADVINGDTNFDLESLTTAFGSVTCQ